MTGTKIWSEWKLQGGGEEKVAGETLGPDPAKSRTHIEEFGGFLRLMGEEQV